MSKFLILVQNEWKKLFCKKSTWVMIILFVLMVTGFTGLLYSVSRETRYYTSHDDKYSWEDYLEYEVNPQIEYFSKVYTDSIVKDDNGNIAYYDSDAKINLDMYTYIKDNNINYNDWRREHLYDLFSLKLQYEGINSSDKGNSELGARYNRLKQIMDSNDFKAYYNLLIEDVNAVESLGKGVKEAQIWHYSWIRDNKDAPTWETTLAYNVFQSMSKLATLDEKIAAGDRVDQTEYDKYVEDIAIGKYRLENDIEINVKEIVSSGGLTDILVSGSDEFNFWKIFTACRSLITVVGVICIVIAGSIVASEFSSGTYKFLLMAPVKRWKILVAKFVTAMLFGLMMLCILFVTSFLFSGLFFGFSDITVPIYNFVNGALKTSSALPYMIMTYFLNSIQIVILATFALALSTLAKSNALAISLSVVALMLGTVFESVVRMLQLDFGRYLLFANLDLVAIKNGAPPYAGQTLFFGVAVILCHFAVFALTAWDAFTRREM